MSTWDEVLDWHHRDLEERSRSAMTWVPLDSGEERLANDVTEDDLTRMEPQVARITLEMLMESIEAEKRMVVMLVEGKEVLKHMDRLEESDLPHLAAYMEKTERERRDFAEACAGLATLWGGMRDIDRFEGKEPSPDETLGERFLDVRPGDDREERG